MKKIFFAALLLCFAANATADEVPSLTLSLTDGSHQTFTIHDVRNIKYISDNMVMTLTNGTKYSVAIDQVACVSFSSTASRVTLTSDAEGQRCSIFAIDGTNLGTTDGSHLGATLQTLPHGTYIVRIGSKTIKMTK